jgi:hypothetical protein
MGRGTRKSGSLGKILVDSRKQMPHDGIVAGMADAGIAGRAADP